MKKILYILPLLAICLSGCQEAVVEAPQVQVQSVTVDKAGCEITMGEAIQLSAKVLPEDAADKTIAWISTDESVAIVDATGLVKGIAKGTATIRAIALSNGKMGICAVQVLSDGSDADKPSTGGSTIEDFN